MARLVKDFDADYKDGNYKVVTEVGGRLPAVTVYDNRTGSEAEYYKVYSKPIKRIEKDRRGGFILYV